ncbi:MAG: HD domain-containing protein, partial [Azovibrio sp.]
MVSVTHSVASHSDYQHSLKTLSEGLGPEEAERISEVLDFARDIYGDALLGSGEGVWSHALGMALIVAGLRLDLDSRLAALLFAVPAYSEQGIATVSSRFD